MANAISITPQFDDVPSPDAFLCAYSYVEDTRTSLPHRYAPKSAAPFDKVIDHHQTPQIRHPPFSSCGIKFYVKHVVKRLGKPRRCGT